MVKQKKISTKKQLKVSTKKLKKDLDITAKQFQKERIKQMDLAFRIINPCIKYDKDYDILYIWFGGKNKVKSTVEVSNDTRIDISSKGNILAIELCNFQKKIKSMDC